MAYTHIGIFAYTSLGYQRDLEEPVSYTPETSLSSCLDLEAGLSKKTIYNGEGLS